MTTLQRSKQNNRKIKIEKIRTDLIIQALKRKSLYLGVHLSTAVIIPSNEWKLLQDYIISLRKIVDGGKENYDKNMAKHKSVYGNYI